LDVELMLQIANACLRINQGNVQGLLSDECSSPDYGKWENSWRHQMCSFAALRVVGDRAGKFGASIQSGKAATAAAAVGSMSLASLFETRFKASPVLQ